MARIRFSLLAATATLVLISPGHAAESTYYSFLLDGKSLGSAELHASEVTWNGKTRTRLISTATLKFAMLGTTRKTVRKSTTLVDPADGKPVFYELTQDTNGTVTHIECKFEDKQVRTWKWDEGDKKGEPQVTALAKRPWILGSNNFAHWNILTKAAVTNAGDGRAEFSVFLPDAGVVQNLRLVRGERAEVACNGTKYTCHQWDLEGAGLKQFVDDASGQLVKMSIPSQKTTVTLSDKRTVQDAAKEGAQEILAQHFVQSNVSFDDFLAIRMLRAKIGVTVIGEGVANKPSVLKTYMQAFDGKKQDAHVTGTVTIHSTPYTPKASIPFTAAGKPTPDLAPWREPSLMIESDDPEIVSLAKGLTENVFDRWQAVLKIAGWVHKNVRYSIADSPSARQALKKRTGDCGPHATLTVAMLRAVGVPAKLVGGLVYTPSFGGSFGQHAWIEVYMEKDGWIALDPTTGELDELSAVHIKLFEGMGGVVPEKIEVLDYAPTNRTPVDAAPAVAKPLPWKYDHDYTYTYFQNGKKLGTQVFHVARRKRDDRIDQELTSKLDLTASGTHVVSTTRMVLQPNVLPVSFHRDFQAGGTKVTRQCDFRDGAVHVAITGAAEMQRDIAIKPGTYCFDNNLIPSFAMICAQLDLKENTRIPIRTFHPTSMSLISLTFEVKEMKTIKVAGQDIECFECAVAPLNNTFWITRDRRLVKVEAPGVVIDLSPGTDP